MNPLIFPWAPSAIELLKRGTPVCALKPGPRLQRILETAATLGVLPSHVLAIADRIDFGPAGTIEVFKNPVARAATAEGQTANDQPPAKEQELTPSPRHPDKPKGSGGRHQTSCEPKAGSPSRGRKEKSSRRKGR